MGDKPLSLVLDHGREDNLGRGPDATTIGRLGISRGGEVEVVDGVFHLDVPYHWTECLNLLKGAAVYK